MNKLDINRFNFDLDNDIEDVSISDTIYPVKQKINKDSLSIAKSKSLQTYCEKHPRIKVGDILYDNFSRNKNGELISLGYKDGNNEIGICCIQPDFLPDKEVRFIGYDHYYSAWGQNQDGEIENLPCIYKVLTKSGVNGQAGYLYSDKFPNGYSNTNKEYHISNPYLNINKFNKEWLTSNQVLSDLQGWKNQEIILKHQGKFGYSACQECFKYSTKNTKQGEWYLPAAGELAIMFAKFNAVNEVGELALRSDNFYWSSTQYSCLYSAYTVNISDGYISSAFKGDAGLAHPFFHIALADDFQNDQLNESYNFDLDNDIEDVSISDTIYPIKQRINKDSLNIAKSKSLQIFWKTHPRIKVGDYLYSNYTVDESGNLLSLGDDKDGEMIAVCCIQPDFLPDGEVRFVSPKIKKTKGLSYIESQNQFHDVILPNGSYHEHGQFPSDIFANEYKLPNDSENIAAPYVGINKFNQQWLDPASATSDLQGWKNLELRDYFDMTKMYDADQWYMPSMGELGIAYYKFGVINKAFAKYKQGLLYEYRDSEYLTSTQYIDYDEVNTYFGVIYFEYGSCYAWKGSGEFDLIILPFRHFKLSDNFYNDQHLNESFNFDLDNDIEDVSISDTIYPIKQRINKDSLVIAKKQSVQTYYETHPRIKVGDILYSNFERNEDGKLVSLGYKNGENEIGICVIQPDFLPDKKARFAALEIISSVKISYENTFNVIFGFNYLTDNGLQAAGSLYSDKFSNGYSDKYNSYVSNPYLNTNKFNKEWLLPNQVLSNLDGQKNQKDILEEQGMNENFACQRCYKYRTIGTNKGEWYVPSIGELGIAFAKCGDIFKNRNCRFGNYYWSSTRCSFSATCFITSFGFCNNRANTSPLNVIPFIQFSLADDFQEEILNEDMMFDLDNDIEDVSISDTIYPVKQKINKDVLQKDKEQFLQKYYEKHPKIKVGDILYDNFTRDDDGKLLSLGDENGEKIGVCCIQPYFLPDHEARFVAYKNFYFPWGEKTLIDNLPLYNPHVDIPSDKFTNGNIAYKFNSDITLKIPTPYIDNKFNKEWLCPKYGLNDFQGWKNQEIILKEQGLYVDFACQQCYYYCTENTNKGEWYLPSIGELGLMFNKHNVLIASKLHISWEETAWSSTQYSSNSACCIGTTSMWCASNYKDHYSTIHPFFHIAISPEFDNMQLNENMNFDLDNDIEDTSISDTIYPVKQKINKDSLQRDKAQSLWTYYEKHPRIKVGDILYDNFKRDENGDLLDLGYKDGNNEIGICVIQPDFLPDMQVRFAAIDEINNLQWGSNNTYIFELSTHAFILTKDGKKIYGVLSFSNNENVNNVLNPYIDINKFNMQWLNQNQCLSDLQGWNNQKIILKNINSQACNACYNYFTKNTKCGDWYLPAFGELELMCAKADILNEQNGYLSDFHTYWTSTQEDEYYAWVINSDGECFETDKEIVSAAKPFIHFKLSEYFGTK